MGTNVSSNTVLQFRTQLCYVLLESISLPETIRNIWELMCWPKEKHLTFRDRVVLPQIRCCWCCCWCVKSSGKTLPLTYVRTGSKGVFARCFRQASARGLGSPRAQTILRNAVPGNPPSIPTLRTKQRSNKNRGYPYTRLVFQTCTRVLA